MQKSPNGSFLFHPFKPEKYIRTRRPIMFCSYCGTQIPQDAVFCFQCGKRQKKATDELKSDVIILPSSLGASGGSSLSPLGNAPVVPGTPSTPQFPVVPGSPQASPPHSLPPSPSQSPGSSPLSAQHSPAGSQPVSEQHPTASSQPVAEGGLKLAGGLSRRAVMVGLAGATVVAVGGGAIIWRRSSQGHSAPSASGNSPAPTLPLGTRLYTYHGHANAQYGYVSAVAWSPDGKRIASGSDDSTVQVWDAIDGGNVFTYRGHASWGVLSVAWSPNGKRIASGGADGTV